MPTGTPVVAPRVSGEGRPIDIHTFGHGPVALAFVGAIHGGYEWNTANLAYQAIDYFTRNPSAVPQALTLHIIPVANPDGLARIAPEWAGGAILPPPGVLTDTLPGRFNANDVDLNRNWDCNWAPNALWRDQPVSAGSAPFSEKETAALRDFLLAEGVEAVIFWHSAAGVVLPGRCGATTHPPSEELAAVYSAASEYPVVPSLSYEITGDASDWLTTQDIASIAVELTDHTGIEWERNLAGLLAVLDYYVGLCDGGECGAGDN
jgi:hypothetical protein